jgi:membrane fusion protein (multidrug efflux system)
MDIRRPCRLAAACLLANSRKTERAAKQFLPYATLWVVPFALLILSILSSCSGGKVSLAKADSPPEKEKPVAVKVFAVESRDVRRTVEAVGSLFAFDEVVVSSEVDGRAESVLVDVGDHVTKGQTLVEVLPIEFKLAADQQQAIVEQAIAKLGLTEAQAETIDPKETAAVKKAAADLANAEQKYRRSKQLVEQGIFARQTFEEDEATYNAARATYDLAVQDVRNLQAALKQERALRDLAAKKLRDTKIVAPFSGYIRERDVTVGQYLKVQTPVMAIVNNDPVRVRLKVPEKMAAWVPVGQFVTVSVEAYPNRTFSGKIWRINPSVDPQTRTFDAEALIDNHQGVLKPGFFVKASIPSTQVDKMLVVPQNALSYAYGIYKVYTIAKGNRLKEREVKVGDRLGEDVEVIDGLKGGDRLALPLEGQELAMKDGASVKLGDGGAKAKAGSGEDSSEK